MFLDSNKFRTNALSCLHAIVHKGMDYPQKIELIVNMKFLETLESFQIKFRDRSEDADIEE